jgi:hypothetical protein
MSFKTLRQYWALAALDIFGPLSLDLFWKPEPSKSSSLSPSSRPRDVYGIMIGIEYRNHPHFTPLKSSHENARRLKEFVESTPLDYCQRREI